MKRKPVRVKRKNAFAPAFILLAALVIGAGVSVYALYRSGGFEKRKEPIEPEPEPVIREGDVVEKADEPKDTHLREDKSIYSETSELDQMVTMYLTVRSGNAEDSTNHTWTEVNTYDTYYYSQNNIDRYACEAILQVGDENGPLEGEFGYGETVPNATVCIRGQTSSRNTQKNYKIRIKDGKGTYRDMQTIPLNKYSTDDLRFRNKLVFDLMQPVPQMTAIRTQFVHLYVKDETAGGSGEFEDYGLYTRLEQMNKDYLENHGLDRKGYFYKLVVFEFYDYEPLMISENSLAFDSGAFEEILKPKGDTNHSRLRELLTEVNDYTIPIEKIVDKYFDVENISYFLAYHMLVGNTDVGPRNEYLYSPLNSEKWYFLSWDCDGSLVQTRNRLHNYSTGTSWECGITQYTVVVLFNRMLKVPEYREALDKAVNDLRENYLTKEKIDKLVNGYKSIVIPFLLRSPDKEHWGITMEEYDYLCESLASEVEYNYQIYLESLEKPWPFYVGLPEITKDGTLNIDWNVSYDLDNEDITYTCILSRDAAFTDVIARVDNIRIPECTFDVDLPAGTYFIRVQATNESGYTQECFDYYSNDPTANGKRYGCYAFTRKEDGTFEPIIDIL